jgi:hypothetical protein
MSTEISRIAELPTAETNPTLNLRRVHGDIHSHASDQPQTAA